MSTVADSSLNHSDPPAIALVIWRAFCAIGRGILFAMFAGLGVGGLAASVLLPELATMEVLQAKRDALAHQLDCERNLATYNDRLIERLPTDPILRTKVLARHENYAPAGMKPLDIYCPDEPIPQRILREARTPPPPLLSAWAVWGIRLNDANTRTAMMLVSLAVFASAFLLFLPRSRGKKAAKPAEQC
jgi:hypothetical protein